MRLPDSRGYVCIYDTRIARRAQRVTMPVGGGDWLPYCARHWLPTYACSNSFHWPRHQLAGDVREPGGGRCRGEMDMYNVRAEESKYS